MQYITNAIEKVQLHEFSNSVLDEYEWSSPHSPGRFISEDRAPVSTEQDIGWYPEPVWTLWMSDISSCPYPKSKPDSSVVQSVIWLQYQLSHGSCSVTSRAKYITANENTVSRSYCTLVCFQHFVLLPLRPPPRPKKTSIYIWTIWYVRWNKQQLLHKPIQTHDISASQHWLWASVKSFGLSAARRPTIRTGRR